MAVWTESTFTGLPGQRPALPPTDPEPGAGPGLPRRRRPLCCGTVSDGGLVQPRHRPAGRARRVCSPRGRGWVSRRLVLERGVPGLPVPPTACPLPRGPGRTAPTFAVRDVGGAVEVGAGVAWAGDAVVLAKLGLVGAGGAADAPVGGGGVVVARGAAHCGGGARWWERAPAPGLTRSSRPFPTARGPPASSPRTGRALCSLVLSALCRVHRGPLGCQGASLSPTPEANILLMLHRTHVHLGA